NVYVALTEAGVQTATYVACLDADTGAPRWVRFIHQSDAGADMGMGMPFPTDMSHRLLTLDGSTIYYQTNLGAVAALDAETGQIRWLATYPRVDHNGVAHDRDLNPAIVHDGLVFVAPEDNPHILAFDAMTGHLVWQTDPLEGVMHVLGVAKGRLIATGNQVWSIDVQTGKKVRQWPDTKQNYEGYGRGLLAGNCIYWPTKTEIHILDQATGLPADRPPIKLQAMFQTTGGNLAVGDGYLIVAQADALVVFCQNSRLIERYRDEIAHAPQQASSYFRLAQAAEATNQDDLALKSLSEAIVKAKPSELVDGQPLVETARDHQYHLLMKLAGRASSSQDWSMAARRYEEAAGAARADRDRLSARFHLADVQAERGEPQAAVATLQGLLADERLRPLDVAADEHRTVRADLLITDRLNALLRQHGRELYAEFDRQAERMLERGKAEKDQRLLEEVGRSYPVARSVPDSLLAMGELCETLSRPADAAQAYKRLLAIASTDAQRGQALWGLARAYEAQKLWVPARDTYVQAMTRFGDLPIREDGDDEKLGKLVAQRLAQDPFDRMTGDRSEPSLPFPLSRRWNRRWSSSVRPIGADGVPPSSRAGRIFLVEHTTLRPVDPNTGESAWKAELSEEPVWVGYLADRVIVATSNRLVALRLDTGAMAWQTGHEAAEPRKRGLNPFAKPEAGDEQHGDAATVLLHDFRIVGGRIFCQRGDHELLAYDGDTGLVDWSYSPSSGQLSPHLWIGPGRIVLQTRKPNTIQVLETQNGRSRAEYSQGDDDEWLRDPFPLDDDHIALVVDRRTVALFDLKRGMKKGDAVWTFRESALLPRNGPPRLLGDAERLLVLYDGNVLIRLDPRTGLRLWAQPLGAEDLSDRPEALALDGERFYCASRSTITALALGDGARVWRRHLSGPDTGWSIALTEHCVAAYPNPSRLAEVNLHDLPLVFCRRETGGLVQRVLFQTPVSELTVRLAPHYAMVATQGGLWALGDRPGLDGAHAP
ncbi:MAG TPA: PQQ-binding-like beta-propeller repeat protein, partial [Isosphaeraceae bacterium]|nr:PQQ-binding-like beta-propeller repeat protein [Isosphaeraceae bacterium]